MGYNQASGKCSERARSSSSERVASECVGLSRLACLSNDECQYDLTTKCTVRPLSSSVAADSLPSTSIGPSTTRVGRADQIVSSDAGRTEGSSFAPTNASVDKPEDTHS